MNQQWGGGGIAICTAGVLAQCIGLACLLWPGIPEFNLARALLFYLPGTLALLYALESWAVKNGRHGSWALTALLGPVGLLALRLLKPAPRVTVPEPVPVLHVRTRVDRVVGMALLLLVVFGLVWTVQESWPGLRWPPRITGRSMREAEVKAYRRLQAIQAAQERYKQQDWDNDGKKTYAAYLVHLWQSVDSQGRTIPVQLLPRRLAFAMGEEFGFDGYFYRSLNIRDPAPGVPTSIIPEHLPRLNPENEWALVAAPMSPDQTALISFFTDQSGKIWAQTGAWGGYLRTLPADWPATDWIEIKSEQDLEKLQSTLTYTDHEMKELPSLHLRWRR